MSNKIFLCAITFISILTPTLIASDLGYEPGELIVRFLPKSTGEQRTISERNALLAEIGGGTVKDYSKFVPGLTLVKLPAGLTVKDALKTFNRTDGILHAQPNYIYKALSTFPNDPNFGKIWGMHNTGQPHPVEGGGTSSGTPDADIDAPEAWDIETNAGEIIVAVIDTGVNYTHPDLAANMWRNPGEIPSDGNDNDRNGYIDDIYGYDFCTRYGKQRDSDPNDDNCHGTHCAGIIGAVGNNGLGITGVCWNVKIMALKFLTYDGSGSTWDAIASIRYAIQMGADVLSNSWGGIPETQEADRELKAAIEAADASGVLVIAAAGNYQQLPWLDNDVIPVYPASYDCENIISVMATNHNDGWPWWSHYGATSVDLGAPGVDILSTFPTYETEEMALYGLSTYYETISGTSMATPHIAGACAFGLLPVVQTNFGSL